MGSAILQFVIVNAIPLVLGVALVSVLIFFLLNGSRKGAVFALISSLIYVFIPFFGAYLTLLSGVMALYLPTGYTLFGVVSILINLVNILAFSPLLRANATGAVQVGDYKWAILFITITLIQTGIGLRVFYRYVEDKKEEALVEPFDYLEEGESEQA
jgi:hypothetical protein